MTGIFVRVKRGDEWQSVEIEYLTKEELTESFAAADKARVIMFFSAVTTWMRENLTDEEDSR